MSNHIYYPTHPTNTQVLALNKLTEHADAVLPIDNTRLMEVVSKFSSGSNGGEDLSSTSASGFGLSAAKGLKKGNASSSKATGFDEMNSLVARLLTDLTSSMRFSGDLNTDLNEITTNLVPFPRMHYLSPSLAPLGNSTKGLGSIRGQGMTSSSGTIGNTSVVIRSLFKDCFREDCSLIGCGNMGRGLFKGDSTVLACGVFVRGVNIPISDVNANVSRLQSTLKMPSWNREGFKIGLCQVPSLEQSVSMMCLTNTSGINGVFGPIREGFEKLWRRKVSNEGFVQAIQRSKRNK